MRKTAGTILTFITEENKGQESEIIGFHEKNFSPDFYLKQLTVDC